MYSRSIYKQAILRCPNSKDRPYLILPNTKYLALINNSLPHLCHKRSSRSLSCLAKSLSTQNLNDAIKNMNISKFNQHIYRTIQRATLRHIHITNVLPLSKDQNPVGQDLGDILKELYRERDTANDTENKIIGN